MTIHDIMNMTAADLKASHATVRETLVTETTRSLANRLFTTLVDAKMRDEKLAEQGKTIAGLNAGYQSLLEQLDAVQCKASRVTQNLIVEEQKAASKLSDASIKLETATREIEKLNDEKLELLRRLQLAGELARNRRVALANVMEAVAAVNKVVLPLLEE